MGYLGALTMMSQCRRCAWASYYYTLNPFTGKRRRDLYCMHEEAYPPKAGCGFFIDKNAVNDPEQAEVDLKDAEV